MQDNVLRIIPAQALEQPIISGRTFVNWHMIMDPAAIKRVLLDWLDDYPKSNVTKTLLGPAIGESLFIAEGARWQRRAAAPAFSNRTAVSLAPIMSSAAKAACTCIATAGPRAVDVAEEMITATFDVIADVTLSGDDQMDRAAVHKAIDGYINEAGKVSIFDILGLPAWVPRPGRGPAMKMMTQTKTIADDAIARPKARAMCQTFLICCLLPKTLNRAAP